MSCLSHFIHVLILPNRCYFHFICRTFITVIPLSLFVLLDSHKSCFCNVTRSSRHVFHCCWIVSYLTSGMILQGFSMRLEKGCMSSNLFLRLSTQSSMTLREAMWGVRCNTGLHTEGFGWVSEARRSKMNYFSLFDMMLRRNERSCWKRNPHPVNLMSQFSCSMKCNPSDQRVSWSTYSRNEKSQSTNKTNRILLISPCVLGFERTFVISILFSRHWHENMDWVAEKERVFPLFWGMSLCQQWRNLFSRVLEKHSRNLLRTVRGKFIFQSRVLDDDRKKLWIQERRYGTLCIKMFEKMFASLEWKLSWCFPWTTLRTVHFHFRINDFWSKERREGVLLLSFFTRASRKLARL